MISTVRSFGVFGMTCDPVIVETDISAGVPAFDIVGLPDAAVKESRDRVRAAVKNCGFRFPIGKITVNLAPADIKKTGPVYDLPILLGILSASGQIPKIPETAAFVGELSLNGSVRPINGALTMTIKARDLGFSDFFVPYDNRFESGVIDEINIRPSAGVLRVLEHLFAQKEIPPYKSTTDDYDPDAFFPDFCEVKGHIAAKHMLEVAAAGGHNAILIGPPGTGKSMLAKRIPSILPEMSFEESLKTTEIYSIAGLLPKGTALVKRRPFRSPHHTVSPFGLSGGGIYPRPGEITLAHNGVLFLDEFPEFDKKALEILRQPIEDGKITVSRVSGSVTFPSSFMTIAAMNPCKCGYRGHPNKSCTCTDADAARYLNRISGPLLDRFDLHIEVTAVSYEKLSSAACGETSAQIRERVQKARKRQRDRIDSFKSKYGKSIDGIYCNAQLNETLFRETCPLDDASRNCLKEVFEKLDLSARSYNRIVKVSRTLADLYGCENIKPSHILEAVQYRVLDREYWKHADR